MTYHEQKQNERSLQTIEAIDALQRNEPLERFIERVALRPMAMDEHFKGGKIVDQGPTKQEQIEIIERTRTI